MFVRFDGEAELGLTMAAVKVVFPWSTCCPSEKVRQVETVQCSVLRVRITRWRHTPMVPMLHNETDNQLEELIRCSNQSDDSLEMRLGPGELATSLGSVPTGERLATQVGSGGQGPVGLPR